MATCLGGVGAGCQCSAEHETTGSTLYVADSRPPCDHSKVGLGEAWKQGQLLREGGWKTWVAAVGLW